MAQTSKNLGKFKEIANKNTWANGQTEFHIAKNANKKGVKGHYVILKLDGTTKCVYKSFGLQQDNPSLNPVEFADNPVISNITENGREFVSLGRKQRELTPESCPF